MLDHAGTNKHATSNALAKPACWLALSLAVVWAGACERRDQQAGLGSVADRPPPPTTQEPEAHRPRLSFPPELRVDQQAGFAGDESVNAFIERALLVIAGGEYEPYRLLWSVKDEPDSRGDYEQRWHGVTEVRLRALRRIILTDGNDRQADSVGQPAARQAGSAGDPAYALLADFWFDPAEPPAQREPLRGVVWVVVKEQDTWRLAKPPKAVKRWLREQVAASRPERTDSDSALP